MRYLFLLTLLTALVTNVPAQGVDVDITRAGIGAVPDGDCRTDLRVSDCRLFDGVQEITVAPGAAVALFIEWRNDGTADFLEVRATDQMGNPIFPPNTTTLFPTETAFRNHFFNAPLAEGSYTTLLTLTAESFGGRTDTDQFRYTIIVDAALPVELTELSAVATEKRQIDLRWRTLSETENDFFAIERSGDGIAFTEVGRVGGSGESSTTTEYRFRDEFPAAGYNYYRLRQTDYDGSVSLSEVVGAHVRGQLSPVPNPGSGDLRLSGFSGGWVELYDELGRRVLGKTVGAGETLSLGDLPAGRYLLKAAGETRWYLRR